MNGDGRYALYEMETRSMHYMRWKREVSLDLLTQSCVTLASLAPGTESKCMDLLFPIPIHQHNIFSWMIFHLLDKFYCFTNSYARAIFHAQYRHAISEGQ